VIQLADILHRFKAAAAPGAASQAGVPGDRAALLAAEIGPILDRLAQAQQRCAAITAEAEAEASRIGRQAADDVTAIGSEAAGRAATARDRAATEVISAAQAEAAASFRRAAEAARSRPRPDEADVNAVVELAVRQVTSAGRDSWTGP
jgi:hypothetical protein